MRTRVLPTYKPAEQHAKDVAALQRLFAEGNADAYSHRSGRSVSHMTSSRREMGAFYSAYRYLRHVIDIDIEQRVAWVEPGVTIEELCRATMARGLMPLVAPEFRSITVGGAIMGSALESASFAQGMFADSCLAYELLLADGTRLEVSPEHYPDLFYGVSGSFGSLATLVAAKLKLAPAGDLVRLEYRMIDGNTSIVHALRSAAEAPRPPQFLDAVFLDAKRGLVMSGNIIATDQRPQNAPLTYLGAPWAPWFCQHLQKKADEGRPAPDYFTLSDYFFRYDRGAFWMGQFATSKGILWRYLLQRPNPNNSKLRAHFKANPPTLSPSLPLRVLLGWKLSSESLYRMLHGMQEGVFERTFLVQDFCLPLDGVTHFIEHLRHHVRVYPLWFCPVRGTPTPQFLSPHYLGNRTPHLPFDFINVGVYGIPDNARAIPEITRELEDLTCATQGRKLLYAQNYLPSEEFWRNYDHPRYQTLRQRYGAEGQFPDFYDRTHSNPR